MNFPNRRSWAEVLLCCCLGLGPAAGHGAFDTAVIDAGDLNEITVAATFTEAAGDKANIVVAGSTADEARRLRVYEFSGEAPALTSDTLLADDVILMDVCRGPARDMLVLFRRDEAVRFDIQTGKMHRLIGFSSIYNNPVEKSLPKLDLCRDLNEDGVDDFIIPDFDGFEVFIGRDNGTFKAPVRLHAPPVMELSYENHPWYQPRKIYLTDMNFDGLRDLVFRVGELFLVYLQDGTGDFAGEPVKLSVAVDFQFEGAEGLSVEMGEEDQSNSQSRALYQLADLDANGITDLVTLMVKSEGVFNKQTTYEIHKGVREGKLVSFDPVPASEIRSDGVQFEMKEKDFNRDGQMDAVVTSVELGLGKVLAALLTGSVRLDLEFYQMKDGVYPEDPNVTRKITATFSLSTGDVFFPTVLIADVVGDSLADLLVQDGAERFKVYPGIVDDRLFEKEAIEMNVPMPDDPDLVELADLDRDGKKDIIIRHQAPSRVVLVTGRKDPSPP